MVIKLHAPFILLIIILTLYLGLKALPEDTWSGWGVFSAQTLLSTDHWARDGFLKNYLLFIPIGYSKIVRYLDDPAMRQHARGTITGELIGNRLYYTHYPPGYLIPYALLAKLGIDPMTQRPYFRLLALVFSFSALILLYIFFNLLTNSPLVSFFAILYYSISTMFLDYADSLANQPIDELLRNLILVLSLLAVTRPHTKKIQLFSGVGVWALYFLLSISSYDSTFFVFIWLIGLEIILLRVTGYELGKKILFFASAPIFAFALQLFQNYWYLGWPEVWLDIKGSFLFRSDNGPGGNLLERHIRSMFSPLSYMTALRVRYVAPLILILIVGFAYFKRKITPHPALSSSNGARDFIGNYKYLVILFLSGLAYAFIFTSSGYFPYQGRQWIPWFALLLGIATLLAVVILKTSDLLVEIKKSRFQYGFFIIFLISLTILWGAQIWETAGFIKGWPSRFADKQMINYYKTIKNLSQNDSVIFNIDNSLPEDYYQPNPIEEYYAGQTILNFKNFQDLMRDYLWLKSHSEYPFDAIITSPQKELVDGFAALWAKSGDVKIVERKYVLVLSY